MVVLPRATLLLAAGLLLTGCPTRGSKGGPLQHSAAIPPCPAEAPAPPVLPFEAPEHSLLEFWLPRNIAEARELLVPWKRIAEHNQRMSQIREHGWPVARWRLEDLQLEPSSVRERLRGRLERLRRGVQRGVRVLATGEPPLALLDELGTELGGLQPADEVRVAHRGTAVRCFPTAIGVYEKPWDLAFDLMQCGQLRFGEPVRVAGKGSHYWYVWSTSLDGWVRPEDLSPSLRSEDAKSYLQPSRFVVVQQDHLPIWADADRRTLLGGATFGLRLPLLSESGGERGVAGSGGVLTVQAPSPAGLVNGWILPSVAGQPARVSIGYPPLTRAALLERAFHLLHTPYGWGGTGDKRDCSGLMMDLFAAFGLEIPRNTSHQALAGTRQVEVASLSEEAKAKAIEAASRHGAVLLYMPGHVMLYLGRDHGQLYAFHLFSGYITPCKAGGETMQRVNRTVVTSLELGRGGSRRAFIQRITRLVIFDDHRGLQAER